MERSSKKGKIPQQDWPSIIKRYAAGETLASIARTYDCSPPAISYILSRSRTRETADKAEPNVIEFVDTRSVKAISNDVPAVEAKQPTAEIAETAVLTSAVQAARPIDAPVLEAVPIGPSHRPNGGPGAPDKISETVVRETANEVAERHAEMSSRSGPGGGDSLSVISAAGSELQPEEPRRTLHLPLSHNIVQRAETPHHESRSADAAADSAVPTARAQQASRPEFVRQNSAPVGSLGNGGTAPPHAELQKTKVGDFIDQALRDRVDDDISAFLAAFDAALARDTIETRAGLREATDRLLRAGARTRIQLERLEARVPLPAREANAGLAPNWRPR